MKTTMISRLLNQIANIAIETIASLVNRNHILNAMPTVSWNG